MSRVSDFGAGGYFIFILLHPYVHSLFLFVFHCYPHFTFVFIRIPYVHVHFILSISILSYFIMFIGGFMLIPIPILTFIYILCLVLLLF